MGEALSRIGRVDAAVFGMPSQTRSIQPCENRMRQTGRQFRLNSGGQRRPSDLHPLPQFVVDEPQNQSDSAD